METTLEKTRLTAQDLWRLSQEDPKWERYELDDGELIEMTPAGPMHGDIEATLTAELKFFLKEKRLGRVLCGEVGFELNSERVRAPDIAFLSKEQLKQTPYPEKGFYPGAPELAVEVRSPNDTASEILRKAGAYLKAGTRLVWEVDPLGKTVTIFQSDGPIQVLREGDVLIGGDVLPGFALPLSELFEEPDL